jgi:hypothetical protein
MEVQDPLGFYRATTETERAELEVFLAAQRDTTSAEARSKLLPVVALTTPLVLGLWWVTKNVILPLYAI